MRFLPVFHGLFILNCTVHTVQFCLLKGSSVHAFTCDFEVNMTFKLQF